MKTIRRALLEKASGHKPKKMEDRILDFFAANPNPNDDQVHKLADKLGIESDKFEGMIYKLLSSLIHLKGSEIPDEKFDAEELKMGIEVEKEHVENAEVSKRIAKAHLVELPDYYTRLKKMEGEHSE